MFVVKKSAQNIDMNYPNYEEKLQLHKNDKTKTGNSTSTTMVVGVFPYLRYKPNVASLSIIGYNLINVWHSGHYDRYDN